MLAIGKGGYSVLRKGRVSLAGQADLVTTTTKSRIAYFGDFHVATTFCRTLHERRLFESHELRFWVLMPDHWHGLLVFSGNESLPRAMQRFKCVSSLHVRRAHPGLGSIWVGGFHDRAIRSEESLVDVARYLVANPVRAGLVSRAGLYPFWDAAWLGS